MPWNSPPVPLRTPPWRRRRRPGRRFSGGGGTPPSPGYVVNIHRFFGSCTAPHIHRAAAMLSPWDVEVKPGVPYTHSYNHRHGRLHLTQATLGREIGEVKNAKKSLVQVRYTAKNKEPVLMCALVPGMLESCNLKVELNEKHVTFSVLGPRSVHLAGYHGNVYKGDTIDSDTDSESVRSYSRDTYHDDHEDMDPEIKYDDHEDMDPDSHFDLGNDEEDMAYNQPRGKSSGVTNKACEDGFPVPSSESKKDALSKKSKRSKDRRAAVNSEKEIRTVTDIKNVKSEAKKKKKSKTQDHATKKKKHKLLYDDNIVHNIAKNHTARVDACYVQRGLMPPFKILKSHVRFTNLVESVTKEEPSETQVFGNGFTITNLKQVLDSDADKASFGKKVSVVVTGRLQDGTIFNHPRVCAMVIRLGAGDVVKGLEIGIDGMRVGDKRRVTIPPSLGFGNKKIGKVPPNSTLVCDVELKGVQERVV